MKERYNGSNLDLIREKTIFFDANILIYLFWPVPGRKEPELYASIFSKLLSNNQTFVTSPVVLSEVINRILRIDWDNLTKKKVVFKTFRDSEEGQEAQSDLNEIIKGKILPNFKIVDTIYDNEKVKELLSVDSIDFNDKMIVNQCLENDYILLTHDKDFKDSTVDILSMNTELCS